MTLFPYTTLFRSAFHVAKSDDVTAVADSLKENIMKRQWMCGFPDKLVVITVGDYVVSFFGNEQLVNTFKTKLTAVYQSAEIAYEEAIM